VPERLEHLVGGVIQRPDGAPAPAEFVISTVDVAKETAPVLSWPVGAGDWYLSDGCCADDTGRAAEQRPAAEAGQDRSEGREGPAARPDRDERESTVPHLHFQVLTEPTFFPSDSPHFVFDRFALAGQVTQRIWDDVIGLQRGGTMPFEAASPGGARTNEMPLDRNVVRVGAN
jgi:hypothetical protein